MDEPVPTPPLYFITVLALHAASPLSRFQNYETELQRSPGVTTCPTCQVRVTTSITYRAGSYAWLMCLVFVLCGLVLGCCLIPFFVGYFQTVYHTCPHCHRVLHVHRKTCCR
ncbi:hypothetical protein CRUP_021637 [Coryphaenoides rupestris]|nr:hypothetical protein CRUP_021637 [Coryphaenoides rupestris]